MYKIFNRDNMTANFGRLFTVIYCDHIYNNLNFGWVDLWWNFLDKNGIFIVQTDDSSMAEMKLKLDSIPNSIWLNTCITLQEWGGIPKKAFPRKHDYIFIYANGENYKWHGDRIQIPKVTANTNFNPSGRKTKTPCDVFYDLGNFSTISNERIKGRDGKNIQWQKPLKLFDRILLPFTDENDWVGDPFMGSGSVVEWCKLNRRNCIAYEYDKEIFKIAKKRIENVKNN